MAHVGSQKGCREVLHILGIDSSRAPWSSSFLPWALATLSCLAACGSACCNCGTMKIYIFGLKENPLPLHILLEHSLPAQMEVHYRCGSETTCKRNSIQLSISIGQRKSLEFVALHYSFHLALANKSGRRPAPEHLMATFAAALGCGNTRPADVVALAWAAATWLAVHQGLLATTYIYWCGNPCDSIGAQKTLYKDWDAHAQTITSKCITSRTHA